MVDPPLSSIAVGATPKLATGACGDWRANLAAVFVDRGTRAEVAFPGRYPASCGEREWWVSLLDHPAYVHAMFDTYFRAAGGRFAGGWKNGVAPRDVKPFATLESPPLWDVVRDVNKLSNNVMARQMFLTLATVEFAGARDHLRRDRYRAAAGSRGATSGCRNWCSTTAPGSPGASGFPPAAWRGCSSPRTRATSARNSRARSPSRRRTAPCSAGSRTAPLPARRWSRPGRLTARARIAGYVIDRSGRRFVVVAIVNGTSAAWAQAALDYLVQWVYQYGATWAPPSR